ncbi:MAG: hypothetical protein R3B89_24125 [Polyangiaceae bacterium]
MLRPLRNPIVWGLGAAFMLLAAPAQAVVYEVGPGKTYATPAEIVDRLAPGDLVLILGGATYPGGIVFSRPGTANRKIIVRGVAVEGKLPVISGGRNTIEAAANHYVFENLDITAGGYRCFFHHADDITLRSSVVHDCPAHGLLGADEGSGTLLLEYTEFYHCGNADQHHTVYMATDETRYPSAVFRMQHCYVHDSRGGHSVKSRAARNEIYFNWIEGGLYHELELIGADGQAADLVREDSDVVGNVLRKTNDSYSVRIGGDGTGDSGGRYRFVNNTFLLQSEARPVLRLFDRVQSLEVDNNLFYRAGGKPVQALHTEHVRWTEGRPILSGANNWLPSGSQFPEEWIGTKLGGDPKLMDVSGLSRPDGGIDLRPGRGSPLVDAGALTVAGPKGFEIPRPLTALSSSPPPRRGGVSFLRETDGKIDIGAYEGGFPLRAMRRLPERPGSGDAVDPMTPNAVAPASDAEPAGSLGPARSEHSAGRCGCRTVGAPGGAGPDWRAWGVLTWLGALGGFARLRGRREKPRGGEPRVRWPAGVMDHEKHTRRLRRLIRS